MVDFEMENQDFVRVSVRKELVCADLCTFFPQSLLDSRFSIDYKVTVELKKKKLLIT